MRSTQYDLTLFFYVIRSSYGENVLVLNNIQIQIRFVYKLEFKVFR